VGRAEPIGRYLSAYFRADLSPLVQGREFLLCFVRNPQAPGMLVSVNNRDHWIFQYTYHPERGEAPEQFTDELIRTLVRQAVGLPHLEEVAQQAELRMIELIKQRGYYQDEQASPLWVEDLLLMLGYAYSSQVLVLDRYIPDVRTKAPEETLDPVRKESGTGHAATSPFLESLDQLGRPGTRAPHIWLQWQGKRISLLDLLGKHFVLLYGEEGQE
jgi:putative polyketide hydroxylase